MEPEDQQPIQRANANINAALKDIQNDMIYFKNEVLRDMRKLELQAKGHTDKKSNEIDKRLIAVESLLTQLSNKVNSFSGAMNQTESKSEKINQLATLITKLEDRLTTAESKTSMGIKELSEHCYKYEKMIANNLIVSGFIGDKCKYPNLKEYIMWLNTQIESLNNHKDKQTLDLKSYKEKLEKNFYSFNTSIDRVKATFVENCKQSMADCEKAFNERIKCTEELIAALRTENSSYSLHMKNDLSSFREEWGKIMSMKEELTLKFDKEVGAFRQESSKNIEKCLRFQNEYKTMKGKFIELSEFIKDVRFKANLGGGMNRREFLHMSNNINFKKKSSMCVSQSLVKSLDTELFISDKRADLSMITHRQNIQSATDLIPHKPEYFDQLTKEELNQFSLYRSTNSKPNQRGIDDFEVNRALNNQMLSLLMKKNSQRKQEEQCINKTIFLSKNKPNAIQKNSSPIINNDNKVSVRDTSRLSHLKDNTDRTKDKNNSKITVHLQGKMDKRKSPPYYLKIKQKNNLSQTPCNQSTGNKTMEQSSSTHLNQRRNHQADLIKKEINQEQQALMSDVSLKLSATESKINYLEQETNIKLEAIHQQFKRFFSQFIDEDQQSGSKLRLLKYPPGIFVPSNFDGRNLDDFFPCERKNISLSSKPRTAKRQLVKNDSFLYRSNQMNSKILHKNKLNTPSNLQQTFYSLSVLMNNNPRYFSNEEINMIFNRRNFNLNKNSPPEENCIN